LDEFAIADAAWMCLFNEALLMDIQLRMPESDPRQHYVKDRREQLAKLKGCVANAITNMLNNICDKPANVVSDCVCAVLLLNQWEFSAGLEHLLDRFEVCTLL
jgi:hypothetical protein